MEENNVKKISLSTFFLILAVIVIIIMGVFIYKLNDDKATEIKKYSELQDKINSLNETINSFQEETAKTSESASTNSTSQSNSSNNSLYIVSQIDINDSQDLYNFNTQKWVTEISGEDSLYFIAIDNEKKLYIVDRFKSVLKELDAKLEAFDVNDASIDNFVKSAKVSKQDNALIISTGNEFATYIISLDDFSVKLDEVSGD